MGIKSLVSIECLNSLYKLTSSPSILKKFVEELVKAKIIVYKLTDGSRSQVKVTTLESVEELVTYRSSIRMVLMPNKLWALIGNESPNFGPSSAMRAQR